MPPWPLSRSLVSFLPLQESLPSRGAVNFFFVFLLTRCCYLLAMASGAAAEREGQRHGGGEGEGGAARGLPGHGPHVAAAAERHAAPGGGHGGDPGAHGGRRGRGRPGGGHLRAPRRRRAARGRGLLADQRRRDRVVPRRRWPSAPRRARRFPRLGVAVLLNGSTSIRVVRRTACLSLICCIDLTVLGALQCSSGRI